MPVTQCGRYVHRPKADDNNNEHAYVAYSADLTHANSTLLLLAHCPAHSWRSGNVGPHEAIRRRSSRERGDDGVVVAWSSDQMELSNKNFNNRRTIIHARGMPIAAAEGQEGCGVVGSWR